MAVLFSLITLLLLNIFAFALPALVAAWLFSLVLPMIGFNQALWLSLGSLLIVEYTIQNITDIPGQSQYGLMQLILSTAIAYFMLALSGLVAWALLQVLNLGLTMFEMTVLFSISLNAGFFFRGRSGTVGFPGWMRFAGLDLEEEDFDEDYIAPPPPRRTKRKRRRSR